VDLDGALMAGLCKTRLRLRWTVGNIRGSLSEVITAGGSRSVKRAAQTAFNMILGARP
jgi:hypothetical protein